MAERVGSEIIVKIIHQDGTRGTIVISGKSATIAAESIGRTVGHNFSDSQSPPADQKVKIELKQLEDALKPKEEKL